jgi:hypothetical protein
VLRTILLAVQTISIQGSWEQRRDYVTQQSPNLIDSFTSHIRALVKLLIANAYLYVEGLDADMIGTPVMHSAFSDDLFDDFVLNLYDAALMQAPSILLRVLEMKPKFRTAK